MVTPSYHRPKFPFTRAPEQDSGKEAHYPVIIVGGGMVGLTMALECLRHGITPLILERGETVSIGSRSICQAKRTLEIWDRMGVAQRMLDKGVQWNLGKVFHRDALLYSFNLQPEPGHRMPAFVNLQQYYVEEYLLEKLADQGLTVRWRHGVTALEQRADGARVTVSTPEGDYSLSCDWLIACDGAKSTIRRLLDLEFDGQVFEDKFLITDVRMKADFPAERWFWFEPTFHDGQTALLHKQADDIWRLDLQLGWDADVDAEKQPERCIPRVKAALGHDQFDLEWVSVYVFQCRTLKRYVHDHIIFAGDAAHQVSPFGARGGNGGVQDADNLVWKLKLVMNGQAPMALLETYHEERLYAARENILNSTRATDFMTPKSPAMRRIRDEVLAMAADYPAARALINPGRLSVPAHLSTSTLNTKDQNAFATQIAPGSPALDAPIADEWFLNQISGTGFAAITTDATAPQELIAQGSAISVMKPKETQNLLSMRYDLQPGTTYLFRPDQHIAARWRSFDPEAIDAAVARAMGKPSDTRVSHAA
jgi:3-(3-hydroxy-phenyl)propionate hydroxylase